MNARCAGSLLPGVLLLHGARSSLRIWDRLFAVWTSRNRICAFDRPGHGRSRPAPFDQNWPALEAELLAIREALGITGPWVAAGHSLGGLYARALSHGNESPAAAVLVDPAHEEMRPRLRGLIPDSAWAAWGADLARNGDGINEIALGDWLRSRGAARVPSIVLSAARRTFPPEWDSTRAAVVARELHATLAASAGGRLVIAERSGHNISVDQPELVREAIEAALSAVDTIDATPIDRTVTLKDGTPLRITEFGRGPLLLVLHGGPSLGRRYLVPAMRSVGQSHRVVLYDQRGAGESGAGPSTEFAYSQLIDDVGEVATALGAERFALLGHSWGGLLALSSAIRHQSRVTKLVVVSPTEPGRKFGALFTERLAQRTTPADSTELRRAFGAKAFLDGRTEGVDAVFRAMYRPWFAERDSVARLQSGLTRGQVERARSMGTSVSRRSDAAARWQDLSALRVPVLLVHGRDDPMPLEISTELKRVLPDATLHVLERVGHFPMLERPGDFTAIVRWFLK